MYFKFPVGALMVYDPGFEIFHRVDTCTFEDLFAFGSDTFDGGERCGLEKFEVFAYPLQGSGIIGSMVLSECASKDVSVDIA